MNLKSYIDQKKGMFQSLLLQKAKSKKKIKQLRKEIKASKEAHLIICSVAKETQKQIQYQISSLVTLALKSVFTEPYEFKAEFIMKRNKTECDIFFLKNGKRFDPMTEVGGGVLDVASFALRVSMWALSNVGNNVLFLDEPFKNINDDSRELHRKIAEMAKTVGEKLNLQIIMISMIPELREVANKVILIRRKKGVSLSDCLRPKN